MTHGTPEIHQKWQTRVIQDSLNKQSITNSIEEFHGRYSLYYVLGFCGFYGFYGSF